jgi:hypothetical protein
MDKSAVQQILKDAQEAVDESGVEAELRPLAFEKAVDLLSGALKLTAQGGGGGSANGDAEGQSGAGAEVGDKATRIAKRMHIGADKFPYVYDLEDEDVSLIVKRTIFPKTKANATREVALLYAAARQAGGYDEGHTSTAEIKKHCENMGVLDDHNFSAHMSAKKDWFTQKGKKPADREYKVTQPGYEEAGRIITRITGGQP